MNGVMKKSWTIDFENFAAQERSCCSELIRIEMVNATTAPAIDNRIDNMILTTRRVFLQQETWLSFDEGAIDLHG